MTEFDPRLYGARWAGVYDDWHAGMMDDEGAVAVLAELAGGEPVLEFGVGTGRLAVPLAGRGLAVSGVDISEEMLAKLREKPGAEGVSTVVGDMTTVRVDGEFALAFIAFNSIFVLPSQRAQVDLFRNAAAHLRPGGRFVLETAVVGNKPPNEALRVAKVEPDQITLSGGTFDPVTATHNGTWIVLGTNGTRFYPISGRIVTHHEMDLMAQLAGLELEHRWGDWKRGPFTGDSQLHVSVYRKP
ncbi:class I SAM-dependent DNA methyltransferase [Actinophytocola gossypii]|uniref:Class I SAM-dependent methyltransferase n=1 Tax=Actinophytocola gossypii TaxID=2812003 RepID=A0ABT2J739_9PSEU|nr:class I SAM-dependent methyltransferase [Actinophytocola gossypii]MCT2583678.1 class I SAM-dependent methyltransferase [Actinophytocola gossypii]